MPLENSLSILEEVFIRYILTIVLSKAAWQAIAQAVLISYRRFGIF